MTESMTASGSSATFPMRQSTGLPVLSTIRRHGIAGKLLGTMEEEIRGNGFSVIRMDTHRDNVPMQTWLGSHGFVHCGTIFLGRTDETRMAFEKRFP